MKSPNNKPHHKTSNEKGSDSFVLIAACKYQVLIELILPGLLSAPPLLP